MSLPQLTAPEFVTKVPSTGKEIKYRPFLVREEKILLMALEGGDEKAKGVVQIKDLILGAKIAKNATLEEWKDRPSQIEVARGDLLAEVQ